MCFLSKVIKVRKFCYIVHLAQSVGSMYKKASPL